MSAKVTRLAVGDVFRSWLPAFVVSTGIVMITVQAAVNVSLAMMARLTKPDATFQFETARAGVTEVGWIFGKQTRPLSSECESVAWQKNSPCSRRQF